MNFHLKALRKSHGLTLDRLAEETGLTKSYLSKVERGLSQPSIATALKLAKALHVTVEELFSVENNGVASYHLERAASRTAADSPEGQTHYSILTRQVKDRRLLAFVLYPSREFSDDAFKEHSGEEFMFLHSGTVEVDFSDEVIVMQRGDALSFNGNKPHRVRSTGANQAELLVVIYPSDE